MDLGAYSRVEAVRTCAVGIFVSFLVFDCEHVCRDSLMALGAEPQEGHGGFSPTYSEVGGGFVEVGCE